jgi:hypothetical protein
MQHTLIVHDSLPTHTNVRMARRWRGRNEWMSGIQKWWQVGSTKLAKDKTVKDDFPTFIESHFESQKFILTSPNYILKATRVNVVNKSCHWAQFTHTFTPVCIGEMLTNLSENVSPHEKVGWFKHTVSSHCEQIKCLSTITTYWAASRKIQCPNASDGIVMTRS